MIDISSIFSIDVTMFKIFLVLLFSSIAGFFIALTYQKTHRGLSYSASFTATLWLVTIITSVVLLVIDGNVARAIGIFGAFSIIRFRTSIRDPRDLVFIFMALVSGFAIGAGAVYVAGLSIPFLLCLTLIMYRTGFGELPRFDYLLHLKVDAQKYKESVLTKILKQSFREYRLLNVESREKGKILCLNIHIRLKRSSHIESYLKAFGKYSWIKESYALRSKNDLDF